MDEDRKDKIMGTLKDIIVSVIVVAVIFGALYAYAQVWPPIVVVESGSMEHGNDSHIGTIDTGDIVIVKKVYSPDDVVTYIEGRLKGYKTYGDYGDVIIYHCHDDSIIHRAIMYLKWNGKKWTIRGWSERDYTLSLEVVSVDTRVGDNSTMVNITLLVAYTGKNLIIHPSDFDVLEDGRSLKIGARGAGARISVVGENLSVGSLIKISNIDLGPGEKYAEDTRFVIGDEATKTQHQIKISQLLNPKNTISMTYPSWLYVTDEEITIYDMGYTHKTFVLPLTTLNHNVVGDEGFITMGDHNLAVEGSNGYDQNPVIPICRHLVTYDMISGVARGELPWFGAIKLYLTGTNTGEIPPSTNLWLGISIVTIVAASFLIDYAIDHRREIWEKMKSVIKREKYGGEYEE